MFNICNTICSGGDLMSKTANINVRIDPDLKARVEKLYGSFGLSVTDAINIFLQRPCNHMIYLTSFSSRSSLSLR